MGDAWENSACLPLPQLPFIPMPDGWSFPAACIPALPAKFRVLPCCLPVLPGWWVGRNRTLPLALGILEHLPPVPLPAQTDLAPWEFWDVPACHATCCLPAFPVPCLPLYLPPCHTLPLRHLLPCLHGCRQDSWVCGFLCPLYACPCHLLPLPLTFLPPHDLVLPYCIALLCLYAWTVGQFVYTFHPLLPCHHATMPLPTSLNIYLPAWEAWHSCLPTTTAPRDACPGGWVHIPATMPVLFNYCMPKQTRTLSTQWWVPALTLACLPDI